MANNSKLESEIKQLVSEITEILKDNPSTNMPEFILLGAFKTVVLETAKLADLVIGKSNTLYG